MVLFWHYSFYLYDLLNQNLNGLLLRLVIYLIFCDCSSLPMLKGNYWSEYPTFCQSDVYVDLVAAVRVAAVRVIVVVFYLCNLFLLFRAVARRVIGELGGGGEGGVWIFIYSCPARLISFVSNCFYGMGTWIYEYAPPPPQLSCLATALLLLFAFVTMSTTI